MLNNNITNSREVPFEIYSRNKNLLFKPEPEKQVVQDEMEMLDECIVALCDCLLDCETQVNEGSEGGFGIFSALDEVASVAMEIIDVCVVKRKSDKSVLHSSSMFHRYDKANKTNATLNSSNRVLCR